MRWQESPQSVFFFELSTGMFARSTHQLLEMWYYRFDSGQLVWHLIQEKSRFVMFHPHLMLYMRRQ